MPSDQSLRDQWSLPADVTYLNHGSFGPTPRGVQRVRQEWSEQLAAEPMEFFIRRMENELDVAATRLGKFIGCDGRDLLFVENATVGMNIVAANTSLQPGDEILATDQEYGAVLRIWRGLCQKAGAKLVVRPLPAKIESAEAVVDAIFAGASGRTKLLIVSHVTSPTAIVLPVELICRRAKEQGMPVCIDGPHALAMRPVNLAKLDCDFYAASCHKWLSAPFGSGFLYVSRRRQQNLEPVVRSWGGSLSGRASCWQDEFTWVGTRDPAAYLSIPTAIEFLESYGIEKFREETHQLARYARERIVAATGLEPIVPDSRDWYGSMIALPLPIDDPPPARRGWGHPLQHALWEKHRIEVPILHRAGSIDGMGKRSETGSWNLRVSCHLYNDRADIDKLADALATELFQF